MRVRLRIGSVVRQQCSLLGVLGCRVRARVERQHSEAPLASMPTARDPPIPPKHHPSAPPGRARRENPPFNENTGGFKEPRRRAVSIESKEDRKAL